MRKSEVPQGTTGINVIRPIRPTHPIPIYAPQRPPAKIPSGINLYRTAAPTAQLFDPTPDVLRRFERSWTNFDRYYRALADRWEVYDNAGKTPKLIDTGP